MQKRAFVNEEKLREIVREFPTPFHLYDEAGIRETARALNQAFAWNRGYREYYAIKACPNPYLLAILRDEGCGVPADQPENIFERFYRVDKARDRATGGTGLGLSIARTIVRMHGGDIRAQLPNGPGLLVTVHLPARE